MKAKKKKQQKQQQRSNKKCDERKPNELAKGKHKRSSTRLEAGISAKKGTPQQSVVGGGRRVMGGIKM